MLYYLKINFATAEKLYRQKNWSLLGTEAKNNLHCNGKSAGKWRHKFTATAASAHGRNPIRMAKVEKGRKSKRGKRGRRSRSRVSVLIVCGRQCASQLITMLSTAIQFHFDWLQLLPSEQPSSNAKWIVGQNNCHKSTQEQSKWIAN